MKLSNTPFWIPADRIDSLLQSEPLILILTVSAVSYVLYRALMRAVSKERHTLIRSLFRNLGGHLLLLIALLVIYTTLRDTTDPDSALRRVGTWIGLFAILSGATVFVKTARILLFEYLFLSSMRAGVPLLLVNFFTLFLYIVLFIWITSVVFNVNLAPLLATSAVFSIVLGLALQDTLGNLFAGVALQFDKPYELGDWIEVQNGGQKWIGQVHEITWRATILIGVGEELITIPNRVISSAQVSNFATHRHPIVRSLNFKIPYEANLDSATEALIESVKGHPEVRADIGPFVYASELHESWVNLRLIYFLDNYGAQWHLADEFLRKAISQLQKRGISLAQNRIHVSQNNTTPMA
jgi:small-conductance mechanosensitive channel